MHLQDDPEDAAAELGKMSEVYAGADVCLVVAIAPCSTEGFPHRENNDPDIPITFRFRYLCKNGLVDFVNGCARLVGPSRV